MYSHTRTLMHVHASLHVLHAHTQVISLPNMHQAPGVRWHVLRERFTATTSSRKAFTHACFVLRPILIPKVQLHFGAPNPSSNSVCNRI